MTLCATSRVEGLYYLYSVCTTHLQGFNGRETTVVLHSRCTLSDYSAPAHSPGRAAGFEERTPVAEAIYARRR